MQAGKHQLVDIDEIVLDKSNPRIALWLEMYEGEPTPEQIYQALGAGVDDKEGQGGTKYSTLKNSIQTHGGIIQPVILNALPGGKKVCIEGNIAAEEAKKARLALATDLDQKSKDIAELQQVLVQRDKKLAEAQQAQADLLRKQRELDDAKRELNLTVEKRVQEGLAVTRQQARKEVEDELKLKVMEKEQTIASMQTQIEVLKRKAEQGSQQLQGEVQELELEALLRAKFPHDTIEPVPKGEHGGDVLQRVKNPLGQSCGTILWETKRTKNWSDSWLVKLREDQRAAKAEIAILVSQTLPKYVETFELVDGIWVTPPRAALPVAVALRQTLMEVAFARQASEGQQTKMEMLYQYLIFNQNAQQTGSLKFLL